MHLSHGVDDVPNLLVLRPNLSEHEFRFMIPPMRPSGLR